MYVMPKKKPTPKPARGRPCIYGERTSWLVWLATDVVKKVDKRRGDVSQSQLVEGLLRQWLGD